LAVAVVERVVDFTRPQPVKQNGEFPGDTDDGAVSTLDLLFDELESETLEVAVRPTCKLILHSLHE